MSTQPGNDIGIKKANTYEMVSREEYIRRAKLMYKARKDIVWWAENFFHIVTMDKGLTKIKLYEKQKELLQFMCDNTRIVSLASRQTGKCQFIESRIKIRNKKTQNISTLTIADLISQSKDHKFESISDKFVESFDISDYQVMTDEGWTDAVKIHKTVPYEAWKLLTEKHELICADEHIVFNEKLEEVFVKDIVSGQYVLTEDGLEKVLSIEKLGFSDNMYDIELSESSNHRYYTNGILSHNTTTYTVYSLWLATLFSDKKILICANKLATALEIMDRIRKATILLPKDLMPGVVSYNKGDITFDNGSSIKATSTSSSGARGVSGNCVHGSSTIYIRIFKFFKLRIPIKWMKYLCR